MKRTRMKSFLTSTLNLGRCLGLFMLMSAFAVGMVSCGGGDSDDDSGKSGGGGMRDQLVGTWTITCVKHTQGSGKAESIFYYWKVGTEITFYKNGTYTDTSRSGSHKWDVGTTSEEKIYLEEYTFYIDIAGGNAEVTYYKDGDIWVFCWVKGDYPGEPGNPDEPTTPDKPTDNGKYRVKSITRSYSDIYGQKTGDPFTWKFAYDSKGRIKTYTRGSHDEEYSQSGDFLTVNDGNVTLNCEMRNNLVVGIDWKWVIGTTSHYDITYNKQWNPSRITFPDEGNADFSYQSYGFKVNTNNGKDNWNYSLSKEKNDMNINLNAYLFNAVHSYHDGDPIMLLLPFDYLGRLDYLIQLEDTPSQYDSYYDNLEVTRDKNNLITHMQIERVWRRGSLNNNYVEFDIEYEKVK